jgi:uncharacterized protein YndB with AHSA1/START domain
MNKHTALQVDLAEKRLTLSRDFDAPPAAVFAAWTDPEALAAWWGPHGFRTDVRACDVRPGGAFHFVMIDGEGEQYPVIGTFAEVSPPHRLVMIEDCSSMGEQWNRQVAPEIVAAGGRVECVWTVDFQDLGGRTRLLLDFSCPTAAMRESLVEIGMVEGWGECFEKLDQLLATD